MTVASDPCLALRQLTERHEALGREIEVLIARAEPSGIEEKAEALLAQRLQLRVEMIGLLGALGVMPTFGLSGQA